MVGVQVVKVLEQMVQLQVAQEEVMPPPGLSDLLVGERVQVWSPPSVVEEDSVRVVTSALVIGPDLVFSS